MCQGIVWRLPGRSWKHMTAARDADDDRWKGVQRSRLWRRQAALLPCRLPSHLALADAPRAPQGPAMARAQTEPVGALGCFHGPHGGRPSQGPHLTNGAYEASKRAR
jgi:hypothetical protein